MLYITTRNYVDTYTSRFPLISDTAQDGGHYIPYRIPEFSTSEIANLKECTFSQIVANILNMFFFSRLTAVDVEFTVGKNPVTFASANHRVLFAELWRNPDGSLSYITQRLHERILDAENKNGATLWSRTAVIIAVLFGIYGKLLNEQMISVSAEFDVSVPADDFLFPMAMWFARKMGLPIKTIICACDEENSIWELFHRGFFATNTVPASLLLGLEKIIFFSLGQEELHRYRTCCDKGSIYTLDPEVRNAFCDGFFCSVAGSDRASAIINSVYRSNSYLIDPITALCYGGSQDYRASTASGRPVLLFAQETPIKYANDVMAATGVTDTQLHSSVRR